MKYSQLVILPLAALALLSCGSGGGSGSGKVEVSRTKTGLPVLKSDKGKTYGYNDSFKYDVREDASNPPEEFMPEGFQKNGSVTFTLADGRVIEEYGGQVNGEYVSIFLIDGELLSDSREALPYGWPVQVDLADVKFSDPDNPTDDEIREYFSSSLQGEIKSYVDTDGKAHSMYMFDDRNLANFKLDKHESERWEWTGVDYFYSYITPSTDNPEEFTGDESGGRDGKIYANGDQWGANFGDVRLSGQINGRDVSGSAKGRFLYSETMKGEFVGFDGVVTNEDGKSKEVTFGGFGGEGGGGSFAGVWNPETEAKFNAK